MPRFTFVAFAIACLLQRTTEILRYDRNLRDRRPNWTAIAITVLFVGFSVGSVLEVILVDRPINPIVSAAGGILFTAGFLIRRLVIRALGNLWAIDVDIKPDHRLITTGPYRFCRHPNYLAMLLEMIGFCLVGNAFYTLVVVFPLYALAIAARIRVEESVLVIALGDEYRAYRRSTFALWPLPRRGSHNKT